MMTIDQVPPGTLIFLDANILIFHFSVHRVPGITRNIPC